MEDHNSTSKDEFLGIIIASHHRQEFLAHTWSQIQAAAPLLVGQLVLIGQAQLYNDATRLHPSSKTQWHVLPMMAEESCSSQLTCNFTTKVRQSLLKHNYCMKNEMISDQTTSQMLN